MVGIDLAAVILSLVAGALVPLLRRLAETSRFEALLDKARSNETLAALLETLGMHAPGRRPSAEERLQQLFRKFAEVSEEADSIVLELTQQIESRSTLVRQLESEENALQQRIEALRSRPEAEIVSALARLETQLDEVNRQQAKEGRRSAWRDYSLYVLGVLTPIMVTLILRYIFGIQV